MEQQERVKFEDKRLFETGDPFGEGKYSTYFDRYGKLEEQDFRAILYEDDGVHPIPNLAPLLTVLQRERVLIIAGGLRDKRGIARRCGWEFAELCSDKAPQGPAVKALELMAASCSNEDFFSRFADKKEPTVFVLTTVEPALINSNIAALRSAVVGRHWVVIATVRTKHAWQLDPSLEKSWVEPVDSELYNPGDLEKYLETRLGEAGLHRLTTNSTIADPLREYSVTLGSPEAIEAFAHEMLRCDGQESIALDQLIAVACSRQQTVDTWFHHRLSAREKVIAIALALFDGVEERIAFSAIEELMASVWRKRDKALQFIDYGDLANIREYFEFETDGSGFGRLKALGDDTRSVLLRAAWRTHRRQIIASLSRLIEFILASVSTALFEYETLVSDRQINIFRDAVAETLGEIALLSVKDVEPHLLRLIASDSIEAHYVVAAALRRFRRGGGRDELFEMLQNWRSKRRSTSFVNAHSVQETRFQASQLIGSAMVTIVGELALEDPMDQFSPEIERLIKAYASSNDLLIVTRMSQTAIPALCRTHTMQMINLLPDLLQRIGNNWILAEWFTFGAGYGFGLALRLMRQGLAQVLIAWIDEGMTSGKGGYDAQQISLREMKLAVAAVAMGFARSISSESLPSGNDNAVSPKRAIELLQRILHEEKHQFVRSIAMGAVNILLKDEFNEVSGALIGLVETLTQKERDHFIGWMVDLHCYQRSQQKGGDLLISVGKYECPIWYDKQPDNTSVLKTIIAWIDEAISSAASSFASDVILGIRRVIERSQEAKQKEMIETREKEEARKREIASREAPELTRHKVQLSFLQRHLAVRCATLGNSAVRPAVQGLLASLLPLSKEERKELLNRYRAEGGEELRKKVDAADRALFFSRYMLAIFSFPALFALLLAILMSKSS